MKRAIAPVVVSCVVLGVLNLAACDGCGGAVSETGGGAEALGHVVAYTSVDQVFSEPVFRYCEEQTGLVVDAVFDTEETKSTGVLNRLIAESAHPQADVFWSGDPVRPFVLIDQGLVTPYRSPAATSIPATFRAEDGLWHGFSARARVLLVNTDLVDADDMPTSILALADARWRGRTAIANPLFGTTTMHVAALFSAWGQTEAEQFFASLRTNEIRVASSNGEVKRLVVAGEVAIGLTDTDDAYEAVRSGAPVTVVIPDQNGMGTLLMPTSAVLMHNGPSPEFGQRLIDCLLSPEVEALLAISAGQMPLQRGVATPEGLPSPENIHVMEIDYAAVAVEMRRLEPWLREWAEL